MLIPASLQPGDGGVFSLSHSERGLWIISVGGNGKLAVKYQRGWDQGSWGSVLMLLGFHPNRGCFEGFFCTMFVLVTSRTECTFALHKHDKLVYPFDNGGRNRMKMLWQRKWLTGWLGNTNFVENGSCTLELNNRRGSPWLPAPQCLHGCIGTGISAVTA